MHRKVKFTLPAYNLFWVSSLFYISLLVFKRIFLFDFSLLCVRYFLLLFAFRLSFIYIEICPKSFCHLPYLRGKRFKSKCTQVHSHDQFVCDIALRLNIEQSEKKGIQFNGGKKQTRTKTHKMKCSGFVSSDLFSVMLFFVSSIPSAVGWLSLYQCTKNLEKLRLCFFCCYFLFYSNLFFVIEYVLFSRLDTKTSSPAYLP